MTSEAWQLVSPRICRGVSAQHGGGGGRTGEGECLEPGPLLFIVSPVAGPRGGIKIKTCFRA